MPAPTTDRGRSPSPRGDGTAPRPVLLATAVTVVVTLPVFLASAEAVQIAPAVGLDKGALGVIAAIFFGSTALSSAVLGHVVHQRGIRWGFAITLPATGVALLGLASCQSVAQLAASMAVAGVANGTAQPSVNALLASDGARLPLGLSLGIKETAAPTASVAAGLAVPALALTVGWRWSCVAGAVASLSMAAVAVRFGPRAGARKTTERAGAGRRAPGRDRQLVIVAVAAGCGAVGGNALGTFLVDYSVRGVHLGEGGAGVLFALASMSIVLARVLLGWLADGWDENRALEMTGALMIVGSAGYLLAGTTEAATFVIGAFVASAVGWGWSPLTHYAVISANRSSTARVSGILLSGFATGSFAGPLVFGQLAEHVAYHWIWIVAGGVNLVGGLILWHTFRRARVRAPSGGDGRTRLTFGRRLRPHAGPSRRATQGLPQ